MAKSRVPTSVCRSQLSSSAATASAPNARGNDWSAQPVAVGTACANGNGV